MNYYERHLGDYAKDTAHLSILEHGAYGLLLDRYYATEHGIPADQSYRVSRAATPAEKKAVDVVLAEFFKLIDGVWVNQRAEEEISKYLEKKPDADKKRENEKERQRRSRERRKQLFEELSAHGINMQWNASTETLQTELSRVKSQDCHAPVTRDNTATSHQSPVNKEPPIPPKGGIKQNNPVTLQTFLNDCTARGETAIPEDDPVFTFATDAGIEYEWLRLAWREFSVRYREDPKRYRDWRKVFRNAVRGNWFKVWFCDDNGRMCLTSQGRMLQKAHREAA